MLTAHSLPRAPRGYPTPAVSREAKGGVLLALWAFLSFRVPEVTFIYQVNDQLA